MDLKKFEADAAEKKDALNAFLVKLNEIIPEDMPLIVQEVDATVWRDVDCTNCANCCKTMSPTFTPADISRISKHLRMSAKDFKAKWLELDKDNGELMNTQRPCQFLIDNKCSIYEVRPVDCAEFPHHNKQPFESYNGTFMQNLHRCPATFMLVDRLKTRIEEEYEW